MLILVLGKGKTGSLVAEVARERGHGVRALDVTENEHASALTAPNLAGVDVVIDFTAPEAAVENMRAVLALGGRIVVGTTGWYAHLDEMKALAEKRDGGLLYGTNFSIGVQKLFRLTAELAKLDGYTFSIAETHHVTKLERPPAPPSPSSRSSRLRSPERRSKSPRTASATPRASTLSPPPGPTISSSSKHNAHSRRGFAWAPSAPPSGFTANPARGTSARSSTSYKSRLPSLVCRAA